MTEITIASLATQAAGAMLTAFIALAATAVVVTIAADAIKEARR